MPGDNKGAMADSLLSQIKKHKTKKPLVKPMRTEDVDVKAMAKSAGHLLTPNMVRWTKTLWNAGRLMKEAKAERDSLNKR